MLYRRLGGGELNISVLSFGAWQIADSNYWGEKPSADYQHVVQAAIDAGINLFDTAEAYGAGESERLLGLALGDKRDSVFIASKVSPTNCAPKDLRNSCEQSLRRLATDRIDLYQIHWAPRDVPFADTYAEMLRLKEEGKIRQIGVSNFGPLDLKDWLLTGACTSNQLGYNLVFRAIEHEIVPACIRNRIGILAYMPVLQGILAGRWKTPDEVPPNRARTRHFASTRPLVRHGEPGCESLLFNALAEIQHVADDLHQPMANVALAWTIAQPGITSAVIGARDPKQLAANIAAADLNLPPDTLEKLNQITQPLKDYFGTNADMWMPANQTRIR